MAYTEEQLERIRALRASGIASAAHRDESTTFRSDAELEKLERQISRRLSGRKRRAIGYVAHNRDL